MIKPMTSEERELLTRGGDPDHRKADVPCQWCGARWTYHPNREHSVFHGGQVTVIFGPLNELQHEHDCPWISFEGGEG